MSPATPVRRSKNAGSRRCTGTTTAVAPAPSAWPMRSRATRGVTGGPATARTSGSGTTPPGEVLEGHRTCTPRARILHIPERGWTSSIAHGPGRAGPVIGDPSSCVSSSASCSWHSPPSPPALPASRPVSPPTWPPPAASSGWAAASPGSGSSSSSCSSASCSSPWAGADAAPDRGACTRVGADGAIWATGTLVANGSRRRIAGSTRKRAPSFGTRPVPTLRQPAPPPDPARPPADLQSLDAGRVSSPGVTPFPEPSMRTILVVEDEPQIGTLVRDYLEHAGFAVLTASDGAAGLAVFRSRRPDALVLDLGLPRLDGLDVIRSIRRDSTTPIVILRARGDETDRVTGLELGADDYVVKPFSPKELVARVRAVLRRADAPPPGDQRIAAGDLELDLARRRVTVAARPVSLTATEFELLATLAREPGRVWTRSQLLDAVHGFSLETYERAIDGHIRNLRRKLEPDAGATGTP